MKSFSLLAILFATSFVADAYVICRLPFAPKKSLSKSSSRPLRSAVATSDNSYSGSGAMDLSWDWEKVASEVFVKDERPIILFDGECNLCNGGVNFALDHDPAGRFRFVSLQSKVGKSLLMRSGRNPSDISSIVLCTNDGNAYIESDAILEIAQGLDGPLPIFGTLGKIVPPILRNAMYHIVSENRYRFGKVNGDDGDSCRLDLDGEFDNRFIADP